MKLEQKVRDYSVDSGTTITKLLKGFEGAGGFTAKKLAVSADIVKRMGADPKCYKFLSFPACIMATGTRGVIKQLVKEKKFDAIITTCGMLDHDLARVWRNYYHGKFEMDDEKLFKQGINRLGNVLVPNDSYGIILEQKLRPMLKEIWQSGKKDLATYELCWEIGKRLDNKDSVLYWAAKNQIPIFIPGITDGAVGSHVWMFSQTHDFRINVLKDEKALSDIIFDAKKTGALMIGGGISKHHVIWWNQYRGGLDYAVYVTTAPEWDGSLSGARLREAVSWGKVKPKARYETVEGDATVLLPLLVAPLFEK